MKASLLIFSLLLAGCSDDIELGQKSGILFLKNVRPEIKDAREVEWEVGKEKEAVVSKGLRIEVEAPKISEEAAKVLFQHHGIDSWIYRVSKINRGSRRHLGYVAVEADSARHISENFTLRLYYHAASVSQEFRRFRCPAFNHRKVLLDYEIKDSPSRSRHQVFARASGKVRGDVSRISFTPLIFSAGKDMKGSYALEFALFNSKDKQLYSDWTPLAHYVEVASEGDKKVESCYGVKEELNPLPGSRAPKIEDLRLR